MFGSKYSQLTANMSSNKKLVEKQANQANIDTIFDTPEFVIDVYLDAIGGGSPKDQIFRSLSNKYSSNEEVERNYNHNCGCDESQSKDQPPCACNAPKESSCCPDGEDPYEKGLTHHQEEKKKCTSCCNCDGESPYEGGKSFKEEVMKQPGCACLCDAENPYENGKPAKPCNAPKKEEHPCEKLDIAQKYPLECNAEGIDSTVPQSNCALCLKDK